MDLHCKNLGNESTDSDENHTRISDIQEAHYSKWVTTTIKVSTTRKPLLL